MAKLYTYTVSCSFNVQYTFREDEVEQSEEGGEGDRDPTASALEAFGSEIRRRLEDEFSVTDFEAWADFDCLLGVDEGN